MASRPTTHCSRPSRVAQPRETFPSLPSRTKPAPKSLMKSTTTLTRSVYRICVLFLAVTSVHNTYVASTSTITVVIIVVVLIANVIHLLLGMLEWGEGWYRRQESHLSGWTRLSTRIWGVLFYISSVVSFKQACYSYRIYMYMYNQQYIV